MCLLPLNSEAVCRSGMRSDQRATPPGDPRSMEASTGRPQSREPQPRCCSRPHRCSRESAAATSKTATKQDQANPAPVVASPPTRSTLTRRRGSGRSPSRRWHPDDNPQHCVQYPDVDPRVQPPRHPAQHLEAGHRCPLVGSQTLVIPPSPGPEPPDCCFTTEIDRNATLLESGSTIGK
jgi:hypothetical protein